MPFQAVLLVNLGSPDSTDVRDVRRYLKEFLGDPRVIDVPFVRKVIVPQIILRTRPKASAEAYASIWTDAGSPLIVTSRRQRELLAEALDLPVYLAMRYGSPSIESVFEAIRADGIEELYCLPLYPHYAMSSYETVVERVNTVARAQCPELHLEHLQPFYGDRDYLEALEASVRPHLEGSPFDLLLFSFHGIPVRHLQVSDASRLHCTQVPNCCDCASPAHATCYRHQCLVTARRLAERLDLADGRYAVSFQSRLGSDPWLEPYTDKTLQALPGRGVRRVRVLCPAFVTDCLETLEEIAEEGRELFMEAGGEDFALIPCLNDHPAWIAVLAGRVRQWQEARARAVEAAGPQPLLPLPPTPS